MRRNALSKDEKEEAERLLRNLNIHPGTSAQVIFNLDSNGKVASAELARVVWR